MNYFIITISHRALAALQQITSGFLVIDVSLEEEVLESDYVTETTDKNQHAVVNFIDVCVDPETSHPDNESTYDNKDLSHALEQDFQVHSSWDLPEINNSNSFPQPCRRASEGDASLFGKLSTVTLVWDSVIKDFFRKPNYLSNITLDWKQLHNGLQT